MKQLLKSIYRSLIPEHIRAVTSPWLYQYPWFSKFARQNVKTIFKKLPQQPGRTLHSPMRVSCIGPWNYSLGLGVASKGYLEALKQLNIDLNAYAISKPLHKHGRTTETLSILTFEGSSDICLIHLHPDLWINCLTEQDRKVIRGSAVRVGIWLWETSVLPAEWYDAFQLVDVIWTASEYCAEIFSKASRLPVTVIPHVVPLPDKGKIPESHIAVREMLGIASAANIILFVFDSMSVLARKNPYALVRAFKASGLSQRGWVLVLKTKNLSEYPESCALLLSDIADDPAIFLIDRAVTSQELEQLFLGCDIYASPHSSEGFGLTIAEAMAAEKLVVATNYGGSVDFLDNETGYPVAYRLTTLGKEEQMYPGESIWASVDEEDLSLKLQEAATDFEQGHIERGIKARQRIANYCSQDAVAGCLEHALIEINNCYSSSASLPRTVCS